MNEPELCSICGRKPQWHDHVRHNEHRARTEGVKVVVYHRGYGCDSGCTGHEVVVLGKNDEELFWDFAFDHPRGESGRAFIMRLAGETAAKYRLPIDFEKCEVRDE